MTNQFLVYDYIIGEEEVGERIDRYLTEQEEDWTRSQVQKWIKDDLVRVNDVVIKANYKLQLNDHIHLQVPPPVELKIEAEDIPFDIVFEDQDVIVINKPRGLVVHPAPGHTSGTIVNGLLYHCKDLSGINGILRPGIVHRIDKDTSGLIMVAKNDMAHLSLAKQLQEHAVERRYIALVHGLFPHEMGTIDAPIGRDANDRKKMAVTFEHSKHAITHFAVLESFAAHSLVECKLETGRTHQIRVHMQYIGHPIVGDPKYGKGDTLGMEGQALHAGVLGFEHPRTREQLSFRSEIPQDMQLVLERLRNQ